MNARHHDSIRALAGALLCMFGLAIAGCDISPVPNPTASEDYSMSEETGEGGAFLEETGEGAGQLPPGDETGLDPNASGDESGSGIAEGGDGNGGAETGEVGGGATGGETGEEGETDEEEGTGEEEETGEEDECEEDSTETEEPVEDDCPDERSEEETDDA